METRPRPADPGLAPSAGSRRLGIFARLPLLLLSLTLAAVTNGPSSGPLLPMALTLAAIAAALAPDSGAVGQLLRAGEAVVWAATVVGSGTIESPYLTYLLAPALVGGLVEGLRAAVLVPGAAATTLLLLNWLISSGPDLRSFSAAAAQWVLLAAAVGVVGAWIQRLQRPAQEDLLQVQQAAHRLLVQLRTVARRLPGTLDPATTAEALLHELRRRLPVDEGWVLVLSGSERLRPLASIGDAVLGWDVSLTADSALADAWVSQQPELRDGGHRRPAGPSSGGTGLAVPLALGPSVFGIVAIESRRKWAYSAGDVEVATRCVQDVALALDTGLLFDEIRAGATAEERLRLSREIHDGVAQELASIGYALDGLAADAREGPLGSELAALRGEVTRVVTELRLSLFDMRSGVDLHAGLGAALSEHVRRVGAASGLTVHLTLSEGSLRLLPQAEAELLRIAQEAIANASKHSAAHNLWVRCDIEPPNALLVVEDDGQGIAGTPAPDSYGLTVMVERAARIGARLDIGPGPGGLGARISVALGKVGAASARPH